MRKFILPIITSFLLASSFSSFASNNIKETVPTEKEIILRNQALTNRLEELNAMDKSNLTKSEKQELRKEVKEIQKTMAIGGGVYISVGALILILILLIIFL